MNFRFPIVLLTSFAALSVHATECNEKIVGRDLGPVRNQQNLRWCFAAVAADLVTDKLKRSYPDRLLKGERVSMFQAAIDHHTTQRFDLDRAGKALSRFSGNADVSVANMVKRRRFCTETEMPLEDSEGFFHFSDRNIRRVQAKRASESVCTATYEESLDPTIDGIASITSRYLADDVTKRCRRELPMFFGEYTPTGRAYVGGKDRGAEDDSKIREAIDKALTKDAVSAVFEFSTGLFKLM